MIGHCVLFVSYLFSYIYKTGFPCTHISPFYLTAESIRSSTLPLSDRLLVLAVTVTASQVDTSLYSLSSKEAAFFKAQIGIDDDEDLKRHILEVQAKAYKLAPYPWIRGFIFILVNISSNPVYEHILKLGRERPDAVLLDIGFGIDARKAAADGFPAKNIIASDIHNVNPFHMLELSHELFKTTPASYPACQIPGDVLDPEFLSVAAPLDDVSPAPATDFSSLKSLNPLRGRISAINVTRFFHLFPEDKQLHLARTLVGLLSAQPGSAICGHQVGKAEKGISIVLVHVMGSEHRTLAHSPESWRSMWRGVREGHCKGRSGVSGFSLHGKTLTKMRWSVMRL
ncbi:hypothetical protein DFJ58DRAFT_666422 [Suillus subalutaceus]|uniref:uncharacterized protein n=1 Tax=Suillus subalutaceus TaxID=48586 RepID=UPI001B877306|nr:uncharacterized protein DFJ58DRAFT_666422 [Suillus subalutaceus]KAG1841698.1 hypothetical protein DFJ58DRAFT_666422 [Suillus subalutaceus]